MGAKRLSLDERLYIEKALNEGKNIATILLDVKRSSYCIYKEIQRNGGAALYDARKAHEKVGRRDDQKKPITEDQLSFFQEERAKGTSLKDIRDKLGCGYRKIIEIQSKLSPPTPPDQPAPIKNKYANYLSLEDRIPNRVEALEQQVTIILEILRSKNGIDS